MTTLKQISDKLNGNLKTDFPSDYMGIDIGNYTFTNVKQYDDDGFVYLYTNPNNPNVKLVYNEDKSSIIRYVSDGENVKMKTWRMGKTFEKTKPINKLKNIF